VNDGTATAADVRALIATAQARVRDRFGVELRREVEYLQLEVHVDVQAGDE
jgi:UDP-N-acetylenolpyruvoylglucosamine reductase